MAKSKGVPRGITLDDAGEFVDGNAGPEYWKNPVATLGTPERKSYTKPPETHHAPGAKARIANAKAFGYANLATEWDGRAKDLESLYRDHEGAKDARGIAAAIRLAAERLIERTR